MVADNEKEDQMSSCLSFLIVKTRQKTVTPSQNPRSDSDLTESLSS